MSHGRIIGARAVDFVLECSVVGSFSRLGYVSRRALFEWRDNAEGSGEDRVVVITGATGGLGYAAATLCAAQRAHVILLGRDEARTEEVRSLLRAKTPEAKVDVVVADLSSLESVRGAAASIGAITPSIDALLHNAGSLSRDRYVTDDGLELTAEVHVVAPFLLTTLVAPLLRRAADPRVIFVSSGGMYTHRLDVDALEAPQESFNGVSAYANAKRAQVVLAEQWAAHSEGEGIWFAAMHPGWADTPGIRESLPRFARAMGPLLRTPEQGADTMAWLALDPSDHGPSGSFWLDRRPRATTVLPRTSTRPGDAERLWRFCAARTRPTPMAPT